MSAPERAAKTRSIRLGRAANRQRRRWAEKRWHRPLFWPYSNSLFTASGGSKEESAESEASTAGLACLAPQKVARLPRLAES